MKRKDFLKAAAILPLTGIALKLHDLHKMTEPLESGEKMPVLFVGHGNPMNAIEENEFVAGFRKIGKELPKPKAILCISAHWETKGTFVTAMEKPRTIHDFGGFPQALFDVQYPAPGSPQLASETKATVQKTEVGLDKDWGLDHGCWTVVKHFYPKAEVPVIQMSLDFSKPPRYHYELAKELAALRRKGVLILGSGNMVHNLGRVNWQSPQAGYDWAVEADQKFKQLINSGDHLALANYESLGQAVKLSVPTPEHYLPLLYTLALQEKNETVSYFNDKTIMGSISMTSLKIG